MIYYWFVLGAAIGSFLNVLIHRLPRGESIVFPSSYCPHCKSRIPSLDLVPIIGYLILLGRCRKCRMQISFRYPLVELLTAGLFSLIWWFTGGNYLFFFLQVIFACALLVIFFSDLEQQLIPDAVTIPAIVAGLVYQYFRGGLISALIGAPLGFILLFGIGWIGRLWYKKEVMGEGDWLVAALLGAYLGWDGGLLAIFLAFLIAALFSIILLVTGRVKFGNYIPFGPALAGGGMIALFWGERIITWYRGLFL